MNFLRYCVRHLTEKLEMKVSGRECVCLERVGECTEREREMESVFREREGVCFEIERECV